MRTIGALMLGSVVSACFIARAPWVAIGLGAAVTLVCFVLAPKAWIRVVCGVMGALWCLIAVGSTGVRTPRGQIETGGGKWTAVEPRRTPASSKLDPSRYDLLDMVAGRIGQLELLEVSCGADPIPRAQRGVVAKYRWTRPDQYKSVAFQGVYADAKLTCGGGDTTPGDLSCTGKTVRVAKVAAHNGCTYEEESAKSAPRGIKPLGFAVTWKGWGECILQFEPGGLDAHPREEAIAAASAAAAWMEKSLGKDAPPSAEQLVANRKLLDAAIALRRSHR